MESFKDSIANATTLTGLGSAMMSWETPLTIVLILTGIVLNVVRIYESSKKK